LSQESLVQHNRKKHSDDQRVKKTIPLYLMARSFSVIAARNFFHCPIGVVKSPDFIFRKLTHPTFFQTATLRSGS
jgi:hypothetical protein